MQQNIIMNLELIDINKFYKRNDNCNIKDYIFVIQKVEDVYFYKNFIDIGELFSKDNTILNCKFQYIKDNFTEISLEDIVK